MEERERERDRAGIFNEKNLKERLLKQVKEAWENAPEKEPDFLQEYQLVEQKENEKRLSQHIEQVRAQLESYPPFAWQVLSRTKWKRNTEKLLKSMLLKEPLLLMEKVMTVECFDRFYKETKRFIGNAREFDESISIEDLGQALRNYLVYAIFLELNGKEQCCKPSIFGYSMLYPYTDNYIDNAVIAIEDKKHYNKLIENKLRGNPFEILSEHEKKTAELLDDIAKDYASSDEVFKGLYYMLEAQKNSQRQSDKKEELKEEEILDISIYKGGLSVLLDRYFIDKDFNGRDLYFYYGFGFLLQLCDDLQDITQDGEEESRTVFTVCRRKEETAAKVNKLLHFTKELFEECDGENKAFKEFILGNCYLLILFSAAGSRKHLTDEWLIWEKERIPVSVEFMDKIKIEMTPENSEEQNRKYGKILDSLVGRGRKRNHGFRK